MLCRNQGHDQAHWLVEVQVLAGGGVIEDRIGISGITHDHPHPLGIVGQQGPGVRQDERINVYIHHPHVGVHFMCDLIDVTGGQKTGPDVEQLRDPALAYEVVNRSAEEGSIVVSYREQAWMSARDLLDRLPVDFEVVLPPRT